MITCKEDLVNRYVNVENKELLELFYQACDKFGLKWRNGKAPRDYEFFHKRIGVEHDLTLRQGFLCESYSELTLSDFKPVRTEYVQVTESIFDLRDELERGELFFAANGDTNNMRVIETELHFVQLIKHQLEYTDRAYIYRRVEKVVDWQDEVVSFLGKEAIKGDKMSDTLINELNVEWDLMSKDDFLEMCRVALRANGEIE